MKEEERRQRLIDWLEVIHTDVEDLLLDDDIFWQLQDIVRSNSRFKGASGLFTQWMTSAFIQATAVGVRRQAKADKDSISLKRFLVEVQKYPELVSRKHYLSFFADKEKWLREKGEEEFDHIAGAGAAHIPADLAQTQLDELAQAVTTVERYVDRRIAHYDKRGLAGPVPTFQDLIGALRALERIVIFYWTLLKGSSMTTMKPTIQFDWQNIFYFPWIPPPEGGPEIM